MEQEWECGCFAIRPCIVLFDYCSFVSANLADSLDTLVYEIE